ncbi:MAG: hypothetical protein SPH07_01510 [Eubacteriales bacterium]|nr:hypothetical protein [Eubacteriales bacterium]
MKKLYKNTIDFEFCDKDYNNTREQLILISSKNFSEIYLYEDIIKNSASIYELIQSYINIFDGKYIARIHSIVSEEVRYAKCLVRRNNYEKN